MTRPVKNKIRLLLIAICYSVLVIGCSGPAPIQTSFPANSIDKDNVSIDPLLAYAATKAFPENVILMLQASERLMPDQPIRAKEILDTIDYDSLPESLKEKLAIQQAYIADLSSKNWQVFNWLDRPAIINSDNPAIISTAHILRAKAYNRFTEYSASLDEWISAMPMLSKTQQAAYQSEFWHTLLHVSDAHLKMLLNHITDTTIKGWIELAILYHPGAPLEQQLQALQAWKEQWVGHSGNMYFPHNFEQLKASSNVKPQKIAILLPLSGELATAGTAIRDGIIAASYSNLNNQQAAPDLIIMDTTNQDINQLADTAIHQGAELIIGPLKKQNISKLSSDITTKIPILALNYLDTPSMGASSQLYQFGLSTEDEVKMIASRAKLNGHKRAIVLTPDSEWGQQAAHAFLQMWQNNGGEIAAATDFNQNTNFSQLIAKIFNIDQSKERAKNLRRLLKEQLGFKIRRRQDVDMIFIAASPAEARQIKPALSYQFAGSIPVYATSNAFSGKINTSSDHDLDGIRLPIMPWFISGEKTPIERSIITNIPQSQGLYGALYALGVDAYALYPKLQQLSSLPGSQINGLTGRLSIDKNHRIDRTLTWQMFHNGRLIPLPVKQLNKSPSYAVAPYENKH